MKLDGRSITIGLFLAFILGVALAAYSGARVAEVAPSAQGTSSTVAASDKQADFWIEVGKAGLQLALVSVVGGAIAASLKVLEEKRATDRKTTEARQTVLRQLRAAYGDLKRIRRELRVQGFTGSTAEIAGAVKANQSTYETCMRQVSDAQLGFEDVDTELNILPEGKSTAEDVHSIDTYLGGLVTEWEGNSLRKDAPAFSRLKEFTDNVGTRDEDLRPPKLFDAGVKADYKKAVEELLRNILG